MEEPLEKDEFEQLIDIVKYMAVWLDATNTNKKYWWKIDELLPKIESVRKLYNEKRKTVGA